MNCTCLLLDQILDKFAALGYQMIFQFNGDVGFDIVIDTYERAIAKHNLIDTEHRWGVKYLDAVRDDQFKRAANSGIAVYMGPFRYIY